MIDIHQQEDCNHAQRQHFADGEHELPAIAHHLALTLGHRIHDVGVAVGNVRAERHAEDEAHNDQHFNALHEGLCEGDNDEHDHRGQEHHATTDFVGQPATGNCTKQRATLGRGCGEAEQQRIGVVLGLDEHQHEGDGVQIPGFHQDR